MISNGGYVLSDRQLDMVKEIINIGVGQAAASLNDLVDSHIELSLPEIELMSIKDIESDHLDLFHSELSSVHLPFSGHFAGTAMLTFPTEDAIKLVSALTGEDSSPSGLDAVMAGTLNEVGNIVINGIIGSISNQLREPLDYSLPGYFRGKLSTLMARDQLDKDIAVVMAYINFSIESLRISGNIVLIFELLSFGNFISTVDKVFKAMGIDESE
jgi:chemotaxis protein CheC